jgi:signal transduction histidine kinase
VLVAVLVPAAVVEGVTRPDLSWRAVSVVVCAGLVATLLWRRTHPVPMIAVAMGVCTVAGVAKGGDFPDQTVLAYLLLLPFAAFRWGSGREAVLGAAIFVGKLGVDGVAGYLGWGDIGGGIVVLALSMALGAVVRYRSRVRVRELDQVKLRERERLARDLHDTVAHHVSAMAIRAQAGIATAPTDPRAAVDALRVIDAEAARALDEMRAMVRILRATDPDPAAPDPAAVDLAPSPRVADLTHLAAHTGTRVEVAVTGDVDSLPTPVGAAIYRLAQEAVTNARRHARHATRIDVRVDADDTTVRLHVSDDGEPGPAGTPGYGLVGMAERAGLLGGTCAAGPNADRGWTVTAELPRTGVAT